MFEMEVNTEEAKSKTCPGLCGSVGGAWSVHQDVAGLIPSQVICSRLRLDPCEVNFDCLLILVTKDQSVSFIF